MESKFVNNGNEENDCDVDVVDGFDFWTCFCTGSSRSRQGG